MTDFDFRSSDRTSSPERNLQSLMNYRHRNTMKNLCLTYLSALCFLSTACSAGGSTSTNDVAALQAMHAIASPAAKTTKPISVSASLTSNALNIAVGGISLRLRASECNKFTDQISLCNKGLELAITDLAENINQVIKLTSIYVSNKYTLYRGLLNNSSERNTYSFMLSDINGDGSDDLIIWTGRDGGYGGPSFDVYLFNTVEHKFVFNQAYSDLTVGSSGLFTIEKKEIKNVAKDGCCTHIYETYKIEPDKPILIERVTENTPENSHETSVKTERLIDNKMQVVPSKIQN